MLGLVLVILLALCALIAFFIIKSVGGSKEDEYDNKHKKRDNIRYDRF